MLGIEHVASRIENGLRHNIGIIGDQKPAFAGIGVLEGLQAETADGPEGSGELAIPLGPHGVGAIFNHCEAVALCNRHQRLHVTDVPAHMGKQQHFGAARCGFLVEVIEIDLVVLVDFDKHRLRACVFHGTWNRRQRKGVHQHLVAVPDACAFQRHEHAGPAGIERSTIFLADIGRVILLKGSGLGNPGAVFAVAMQLAGAHHFDRALNALFRNRAGKT